MGVLLLVTTGQVIAAPAEGLQRSAAAVSAIDIATVVVLAVAATVWFRRGWHRLDRAPAPWRRPDVAGLAILLAAWLLLGQAGVLVASALFGVGLAGGPDALSLADGARLSIGLYTGQLIAVALLIAMRRDGRRGWGTGAAIIAGVASLALFWPLAQVAAGVARVAETMVSGAAPPQVAHATLRQLAAGEVGPWTIAVALMAVVAAPIVEEVGYRGLLQTGLVKIGVGRWAAIAATSVFFTAMHVSAVATYSLAGLFAISLGFGWIRERTGGLTAPIAMHVAFNAGNLALALLLSRPDAATVSVP